MCGRVVQMVIVVTGWFRWCVTGMFSKHFFFENTQTHRHTNPKKIHKHTNTQTHKHTNTQTHKHTTQTHKPPDTQTSRHTNLQTHKPPDTQTSRHTNTHTHTHTQTHKHKPKWITRFLGRRTCYKPILIFLERPMGFGIIHRK